MQYSSRLLTRSAIVLFILLALITAVVALAITSQAGATNSSDLAKVKGYIASYISSQFQPGESGDAGFNVTAAQLDTSLDSKGDGVILGEGDDAANSPVLVDNLGDMTAWGTDQYIPGTSVRCWYNGTVGLTSNGENCFDANKVNEVKARVDAHKAAGFSTDVIDYCWSGQSQATTTGGWGFIAQADGLSSDGTIPKVYGLKWGRDGWGWAFGPGPLTGGGDYNYSNTNPIGPATATSTYTPPASVPAASACNSSAGDAELMRCEAQWAIYAGTVDGMTGGNVGCCAGASGTSPNQTLDTSQVIDVRTDITGGTIAGYNTVNIPINSLFTTGLVNVNPAAPNGVLMLSNTPVVGGIASMGLKMLGVNTAPNGYFGAGIAEWNHTVGEQYVSDGLTRPALLDGSVPVDTTPPTVSGISAGSINDSSAVITRATSSEPATMKVEYGTAPGVYTDTVNNTILNQTNKSVSLSGLTPSMTYYYRVTSYDGLANGTVSTEQSFTTACPGGGQPDLHIGVRTAFWGSYADYTAGNLTVSYKVSNAGTAAAGNVAITGATANNGVTLVSGTGSLGTIAGGGSATANLVFHVPTGVSHFISNVSGSAEDSCGTTYTYP